MMKTKQSLDGNTKHLTCFKVRLIEITNSNRKQNASNSKWCFSIRGWNKIMRKKEKKGKREDPFEFDSLITEKDFGIGIDSTWLYDEGTSKLYLSFGFQLERSLLFGGIAIFLTNLIWFWRQSEQKELTAIVDLWILLDRQYLRRVDTNERGCDGQTTCSWSVL